MFRRRMQIAQNFSDRLKLLALACLSMSVAACAATASQAPGSDEARAYDPYESLNRSSFETSLFLDRNALRPIAETYKAVLPDEARNGIRNVLDNLQSPVIFANNLLQGDGDAAGNTLTRFFINSTIGVAGLMDVAGDLGYTRVDQDFGITLGQWGVGDGPYIFLAFAGPSSPRDLVGRVVDMGFDPITYIYWNGPYTVPIVRFGVNVIDARSRNIDSLDELERESVDYYAAVRSAYRQSRAAKVHGDKQTLPDF